MEKILKQFRQNTPLENVKGVLSSVYFPFFTAAFFLAFYYIGWDIALIYYAAIVGIAMVLLLDDLTPLLPQFLFMDVMITMEHSPSQSVNSSGYFTNPAIYGQIIVLIALYVVAIFARLFFLKRKNFHPTPIFMGLCALAAAFLLNGLGSALYTPKSTMFGFFMAFIFLVVFTLFSGNVKFSEKNYIKIAYGFVALSLLLVVELLVKYAGVFDSFVSYLTGGISYNKFKLLIVFGWGIWNTMGMLLCLCIPAVFMLAAKSERGFLWVFYGTLLLICAFLSMSRQAMLGACAAYVVSAVAVIIKSRTRFLNAATLCAFLLIAAVIVGAKWETLAGGLQDMIKTIFSDGQLTGNGRTDLITTAVRFFAANPLFGAGFFMPLKDTDYIGLAVMPILACNTFVEIFSACGIVGIIIYCFHRVQTVIAFAQKPSWNKFYIGIIVCVLLLLSLVDNHLFNILPTLVYGGLLVFAAGEENAAIVKEPE